MEIYHDIKNLRVWTEKEGYTAYVEYELIDGTLDIMHTYVPAPLEGMGIASQLVECAYDYALKEGLKPAATCTYAIAWLKRHPEYLK